MSDAQLFSYDLYYIHINLVVLIINFFNPVPRSHVRLTYHTQQPTRAATMEQHLNKHELIPNLAFLFERITAVNTGIRSIVVASWDSLDKQYIFSVIK